jgi:cation transport ATPase
MQDVNGQSNSTATTKTLIKSRVLWVLVGTILCLLSSLLLWFKKPSWGFDPQFPLFAALIIGGSILMYRLLANIRNGKLGADWLAGISICVSLYLGEYLAGALVVLMLAGGETLENFAIARASSVLDALARRMPSKAHLKEGANFRDIPAVDVQPNDLLVVLPHEIVPVDGTVVDGHSSMDESFLTGEPYGVSKSPGSVVISGAINGEGVLQVVATKRAVDSRYLQIMSVMQESKQERSPSRRIGDFPPS